MRNIEKWQWKVLIASLLQMSALVLLMIRNEALPYPDTDLRIAPAGFTYIAWGLLMVLSVAYGIFQFLPGRKNKQLHYILSAGLTVVYVSFVVWVILIDVKWIIISLLIFLVLFGVLTLLLERVIRERQILGPTEKIIVLAQISIYTGWAAVVFFFNLAAVIDFYAKGSGISLALWQSGILILLLISNEYWLMKFRGNIIFGSTLIWGLAGAALSLFEHEGNTLLKIITLLGIVLIIIHIALKNFWQTVKLNSIIRKKNRQ